MAKIQVVGAVNIDPNPAAGIAGRHGQVPSLGHVLGSGGSKMQGLHRRARTVRAGEVILNVSRGVRGDVGGHVGAVMVGVVVGRRKRLGHMDDGKFRWRRPGCADGDLDVEMRKDDAGRVPESPIARVGAIC